ncbi:MAG: tetratricopeptide repeat protein, partial [Sedimentisphaerales bacterium]
VFDDAHIANNPGIRSLWPLSEAISGMPTRPVVGLSLALNYAIFSNRTAGYHIFNLAIHLLASLALFGIVRRTLLSERLRARFGEHAAVLAWLTAAIWAVHPLQTESVTYLIQRCESLMGLFYLLTLYSAIRAIQSRRSAVWSAVSVLCCALGMGSKEIMATAPVVVLLYDRTFWAGSLVSALRRRWGLYAGLAATWIILVTSMWMGPHLGKSVGFSTGIRPLDYAMNECIVIVHYIRLSLWPSNLCIDYSWPIVQDWRQLAPAILLILTMLGITAWGWIRNRTWSFLGVWFFGILAPTSSFVPIRDLAFEHRMYLPLAALVLLFVLIAFFCFQYVAKRLHLSAKTSAAKVKERLIRYIPVIFTTTILTALTIRTLYRNADYANPVQLWGKALDISPNNPRALVNLGYSFDQEDKLDQAAKCYRQALQLLPDEAAWGKHESGIAASAMNNLASILTKRGQLDEATEYYEESLRIEPDFAPPIVGLAWVLATHPDPRRRDPSKALELAERAMALMERPGAWRAGCQNAWHFDRLAAAYAAAGRFEQARRMAEKALALASKEHNEKLAGEIRKRLELYNQGMPYREPGQPASTSVSANEIVSEGT